MSYNPFDKPIGETLTESDLQVLLTRKVSEGYFIEFKRELPAQREKIGRSIASFANTYGGWYLVGIEGGEHNIAAAISGFPPSDGNHDPISVITESVKTGVDPTPVFHAQVITLATGHLVVVIYVPREQESPFITKDGRIYRRKHDSSTPEPEANRYALDELIRRGEKRREIFRRFAVEPPPRDPRRPYENSRICVYISPAPFGVIDRWTLTEEESVAALLKRSREPIRLGSPFLEGITGNFPLDTVRISQESILLSQVRKGNEPYGGTSIQLDVAGRCAIRVPIFRLFPQLEDFAKIRSQTCRDAIGGCILAEVADDDQSIKQLRFFDVGQTTALT